MFNQTFAQRLRSGVLSFLCLLLGLGSPAAQAASSADGVWSDISERNVARSSAARQIVPDRYRTVRLDRLRFEGAMARVPNERDATLDTSLASFDLPLPEGGFVSFRLLEAPVMEPALAKKFPELRTWVGQGIDDPSTTLRLDLTPKGVHAQILSEHGTVYLDPYQPGDTQNYISYRKKDHHHGESLHCSVTGEDLSKESPVAHVAHDKLLTRGGTLRTYRLAMAATGEYTAFHGGQKADAMAGIVTTMNRVTGIYEREVGVRFVLVAENDRIIYTDAGTDPYANTSDDIDSNQAIVDGEIGEDNYDVGHLVGTGGGGIAGLGVICSADKATGLTGSPSPVGDGFDIDYVAHELGHQFDGDHTFNGAGGACAGGNRNASTAYEPGSGVTIQAYAGICGNDDLQPNSEDYFHRISLNQIIAHSTSGGGSACGMLANTPNTAPGVTTAAAFTIPARTPFELEAQGIDADGDALTYVWEQFDLGTRNAEGVLTDSGNGPLFRSFAPSSDGKRIFPSLRYILQGNGNVVPAQAPLPGTNSPNWFTGELLPTADRNLVLRVTVRDNRADGGGTSDAETILNVEPSTGFAITAPNAAATFAAGSSPMVTWSVASTASPPINAANVQILLSLDGGHTWPVELEDSAPNNGAAMVTIPPGTPATLQGRIKVKALGNVFFDISDADLEITGPNTAPLIVTGAPLQTRQGSPTQVAVVATVSDVPDAPASVTVAVEDAPAELDVSVTNDNGNVELTAQASCLLVAPTQGSRTYPLRLVATDAQGATASAFVNVLVAANQAPTLGTYTGLAVDRDTVTPVPPAAAPDDPNGNYASVSVSPSALPGGGTLSVDANGIVTVTTTPATSFGAYPVRVTALDDCGAVEVREFTLTVAPSEPTLVVTQVQPGGNGAIEPDECNTLDVTLTNTGLATATGITAMLSTSTPNVTITQPATTYADIPFGETRASQTAFTVSTTADLMCLSEIDFDITVSYGGGGSPFLGEFSLIAGTPQAENYTVTVSEGATIPAGGTPVPGSQTDDGLASLATPFEFSLYGTTLPAGTTLMVGSNGNLQVTDSGGSSKYTNGPLPSTGIDSTNFPGDEFPADTPTLMPFWDDLRLDGPNGGVFTQQSGIAPNRQWTIIWRGRHWTQNPGAVNTTFAVVFTEGSDSFDYLYTQTSGLSSANGASATIGVQAASSGNRFTQHSLNAASVIPGRRLAFARAPATCNGGSGACATEPALIVAHTGGNTAATEGGAGDTYTVALAIAPSSSVTVQLTPDADVGALPASLVFTTLDWNVPQQVTLSAINDSLVEGTHSGTIAHAASGGGYDGVTADVVATLADNDSATYRFAATSGSADETAGAVDIAVNLAFATNGTGVPALEGAITVPVTVALASTAMGGGVDYTLGAANVVIPVDGTSQNVSVTLVDTATAEASETVILDLGAETGGSAGQQAAVTAGTPARHTLTITDTDTAGVVLVESAGDTAVTEGGAGDTYNLVLTSEPTANVTIAITPDADLTTTPSGLTFTPANWDDPQVVTVNAVDDTDVESAHVGTLTHSASGGGYNGAPVAGVSVDIVDNDFAADLAVANVRLPGPVLPGEVVRFEVTVNNLSQVTDVAEAAFDFSVAPALVNPQWTCTPEAGAVCPAAGNGLPSHDLSLPRDTGVLYVVSATVPPGAAIGTVYTATASIDAVAPIYDLNPINDSQAATATVDPFAIFRDGFETP